MTPSICMISAPKHLSPGKEYYPYLPPTAIDPRYPSRRSQRRSEMTVGSQPTRLSPIAPAHPKGVPSRGGGACTALEWGGSLPDTCSSEASAYVPRPGEEWRRSPSHHH